MAILAACRHCDKFTNQSFKNHSGSTTHKLKTKWMPDDLYDSVFALNLVSIPAGYPDDLARM
jgi:hypothetical protein